MFYLNYATKVSYKEITNNTYIPAHKKILESFFFIQIKNKLTQMIFKKIIHYFLKIYTVESPLKGHSK